MIARTLLVDSIQPLTEKMTEEEAYERMRINKLFHLPVVSKNNKLCGLVSDEDIYMAHNGTILGKHPEKYSQIKVFAHQHVFEVSELVFNQNLSCIPVVEEADDYIGLITANELMKFFTHLYSYHSNGAIIVLSVLIQDYSLSQISRIIEENNAKILNLYTDISEDSTSMDVIIKLNTHEISSILQTFSRFDYTVKTYYEGYDKLHAMYKDRIESVLNYLNI